MRGTPGYLAPEWLRSLITEKVDVYSFGVVILEIVCGRRVFDSSQDEEDMHLLSFLKLKAEEDRLLDMPDRKRRPSTSTVVKAMDGAMDVEDDLDYDFWTRPARDGHEVNEACATAPLLPSVLSGPR
ncbi:hypothetical protein CRG98_045972 [Punica granatum]|uniref:Protein kinase domain-containing protein n=1 Tax=Punica granatum TaxID=22663 RepID=A0A2I0HQR0_PUNGR|nr:hypothetical protein CRG98_045972 [Punica granatum]